MKINDKEEHLATVLFTAFHLTIFTIYALIQTKTPLGAIIGLVFAGATLFLLNLVSRLIKKADIHNLSEKLPLEARSFLRRNPEFRSSLALWTLILLVTLITFDLYIGIFINNPLFTISKTLIVAFLLLFLFFLISTRLPDKSGKIIPFDDVLLLLSSDKFSDARNHFEKALKFFDGHPKPDNENCIKDAICALEACLETLSGKFASKDFTKAVKQLEGKELGKIPNPIAEGMIKVYAYRGDGKAVAHAALQGSNVSDIEAELVLNQVASYINYLFGLYTQDKK